jgi:hypothetical protein
MASAEDSGRNLIITMRKLNPGIKGGQTNVRRRRPTFVRRWQ